jgi:hypothetical protein
MKAKIIIIGLFAVSFIATAYPTVIPFPGLQSIIRSSHDIIIARCTMTPDPFNVKTNGIWVDMSDGLIDSQIHVVSALKGDAELKQSRITSEYWLRQGEYYLIFADYHDGYYQAFEAYRVIPLGMHLPSSLLTGKTLDENIKILLQRRLDNLNRQMKEEQEEKQRLEEALPQTNSVPAAKK